MKRKKQVEPLALLGIDTGGTFTDFVQIGPRGISVHKVPSTPDNPARAVLNGLKELMGQPGMTRVTYGTTVATNALLERDGARVAWLTTRGFEDLIEIGRQTRADLYALEPRHPVPLVSRSLRFGVNERMLADGRVRTPISARELARAKQWIRDRAVDSVAVGFLHSYRNPAHEKRVARELRALGLPVSLSHRIVSEYREYERFSTTVLNAYVTPAIARHTLDLDRLFKRRGQWHRGEFRVMQSNGGAMTVRMAREQSVRTLLSGPAGGVVAAHQLARQAGIGKIISLDMGGTSTDVCSVEGDIPLTPEKVVADIPVKVPMVDIHTIGAGGGSVARLDEGGALKVGPESAGAEPGPVCYGRGSDLTVTDANLVLGRLDPERFLGGRMMLDLPRTRRRMEALARRVGLDAEATAWGILQVVNSNMERAIRAVTLERGLDPGDFTLVAFGGAGGLHAADLAEGLGVSRLLIPPWPGLLSAWGMAVTPLVRDFSLSILESRPEYQRIHKRLSALKEAGLKEMEREGLERGKAKVIFWVDMRYAGQAYELTIPWGQGFVERFHRLHESRFGHSDPRKAIEVVTLRVRIEGKRRPIRASRVAGGRERGQRALLGSRKVYFDRRMRRSSVYQRERMNPGSRVDGPAVITEFSSTVIVPPGWRAEVDFQGNLRLAKRQTALQKH